MTSVLTFIAHCLAAGMLMAAVIGLARCEKAKTVDSLQVTVRIWAVLCLVVGALELAELYEVQKMRDQLFRLDAMIDFSGLRFWSQFAGAYLAAQLFWWKPMRRSLRCRCG